MTLTSTNFTIQVSLSVDGLFLFRVSDPIILPYRFTWVYGWAQAQPIMSGVYPHVNCTINLYLSLSIHTHTAAV